MPAVAAVEIYKAKTDPSVPFDSDSIQEAVALFIVAQAIEKSGSLDPTVVAETLYANEWESPIHGRQGRLLARRTECQGHEHAHQLQGGEYKRIYPLDLADTEPVIPMVPWKDR